MKLKIKLKETVSCDGKSIDYFHACPKCGEMVYEYEKCVFCGQEFEQGDDWLDDSELKANEESEKKLLIRLKTIDERVDNMMFDIKTENENMPICPYCEYINDDLRDYNETCNRKVRCENCRREFLLTEKMGSWKYDTTPIVSEVRKMITEEGKI